MHSPGINGEGELRGQPANPGSPGKWLLKRSVCVYCLNIQFIMEIFLLYNEDLCMHVKFVALKAE